MGIYSHKGIAKIKLHTVLMNQGCLRYLVTGTTRPQLLAMLELIRDIRNNTRYKIVKILILLLCFNLIREKFLLFCTLLDG